jgi:hypothetical protein
MALFATTQLLRVRVIIELRMDFVIVDVAGRIVIPLVESLGAPQQLADDVVASRHDFGNFEKSTVISG